MFSTICWLFSREAIITGLWCFENLSTTKRVGIMEKRNEWGKNEWMLIYLSISFCSCTVLLHGNYWFFILNSCVSIDPTLYCSQRWNWVSRNYRQCFILSPFFPCKKKTSPGLGRTKNDGALIFFACVSATCQCFYDTESLFVGFVSWATRTCVYFVK